MGGAQPAWRRETESVPGDNIFDGVQGQQRIFLLRLRRLIWLRRNCAGQVDDSVLKVLDKAIYSTFCDCLEVEVAEEARRLLKQAQ